jgi:hypothetical protein
MGEHIAGAWLGTYELDAADSDRTAFLITYHADGTATATSERAYGAGNPDQYGLSNTHHVVWEAVGSREVRWRLLHFGHDAAGNLTYISRTHGTREFDEDFASSRGSFRVEVFAPGDLLDPLDPGNAAAEPIGTAEGTDEARKLP